MRIWRLSPSEPQQRPLYGVAFSERRDGCWPLQADQAQSNKAVARRPEKRFRRLTLNVAATGGSSRASIHLIVGSLRDG